ncbi:PREDICTED: pentatricopeptide repeat-containing protein At4g18840-like [Ipomoea nil]|uniref:pentatricopeptide repeat-containing protein At4g18840-like n=1 Tax=Ipomoea nil TaxID=35883 RepID=UPI000901AC47|nr:PREDICTED: pentatricopeptide repeat-containing protein At4g18840-like [Ipomoea nil]
MALISDIILSLCIGWLLLAIYPTGQNQGQMLLCKNLFYGRNLLSFTETATSMSELRQAHACMLKTGLFCHPYAASRLLTAAATTITTTADSLSCFAEARALLDRSLTDDVIAWNAFLSVYTELGLTEFARELFTEMPEKNLESWNFMLSGYVKCGLIDEARSVFDKMRSYMDPDDCTLVNVLSACAGVGGLSQGKWVHAYIHKNKIED